MTVTEIDKVGLHNQCYPYDQAFLKIAKKFGNTRWLFSKAS